MSVSDYQIGENLARMRGAMSQKALADEMRKRGWRWSQATVWSLEKGERPLRLAEAHDVADILGASANDLIEDDWWSRLQALARDHLRLRAELEQVIRGDLANQDVMALLADEDHGRMSEGQRRTVRTWLGKGADEALIRVLLDFSRVEAAQSGPFSTHLRDRRQELLTQLRGVHGKGANG